MFRKEFLGSEINFNMSIFPENTCGRNLWKGLTEGTFGNNYTEGTCRRNI
ncbi:hypothetical protein [Methanosarcina siciliae]|nr:hypothetical protein [Methanosarcina siciliae]